eukprot:jgi/Phyca11/504880/fgenesh2_kg.PHYCAscaffold_10_\
MLFLTPPYLEAGAVQIVTFELAAADWSVWLRSSRDVYHETAATNPLCATFTARLLLGAVA